MLHMTAASAVYCSQCIECSAACLDGGLVPSPCKCCLLQLVTRATPNHHAMPSTTLQGADLQLGRWSSTRAGWTTANQSNRSNHPKSRTRGLISSGWSSTKVGCCSDDSTRPSNTSFNTWPTAQMRVEGQRVD